MLRCLNFLETVRRRHDDCLTTETRTTWPASPTPRPTPCVRRTTAFVFQSYNLFANKTALQNVTEGLIIARKDAAPRRPRRSARAALDKVGMADRRRLLSQPALRRPAAARRDCPRAWPTDPEIIYFDEPTSALWTRS